MKLLTKEQQESYGNAKICYICKEKVENKYLKDKNIVKLEIIVIIQGNTGAVDSIYNLKHSVPKNIWIVSHNGSNYDYHFVKKELEEELKKDTCLGENTDKYIAFTVPIEKEVTRIDKNGEQNAKNISYMLQFIDNPRFMTSSLSSLVNNLSEGIYRIKFEHDDKKCETWVIKCKYCGCFLECTYILKMI